MNPQSEWIPQHDQDDQQDQDPYYQSPDSDLERLRDWALARAQQLIPHLMGRNLVFAADAFFLERAAYEAQSYDSHAMLATPTVFAGVLKGLERDATLLTAFDLPAQTEFERTKDFVEVHPWTILDLEPVQWNGHRLRMPKTRMLYNPISEREAQQVVREFSTIHPAIGPQSLEKMNLETWYVLRRPFIVLDRVDGIPYLKVYDMMVPPEAIGVLEEYRTLLAEIQHIEDTRTFTDNPQLADRRKTKEINTRMKRVIAVTLQFQHPILLRPVWVGITSDTLETTRSFLVADPAIPIEIQSFRREIAFYLPATMTIHSAFEQTRTTKTRFVRGPPMSGQQVVEITYNSRSGLVGQKQLPTPVTQAYAHLRYLPVPKAKAQMQARRRVQDYKFEHALLVIEAMNPTWRMLIKASVAEESPQSLFLGATRDGGRDPILWSPQARRHKRPEVTRVLRGLGAPGDRTPSQEIPPIQTTHLLVVSRFFPFATNQDPIDEVWTPQDHHSLLLMLNTTSLLVTGTIVQTLQRGAHPGYHKFEVMTGFEAAPVQWEFGPHVWASQSITLLTSKNPRFLDSGSVLYYGKGLGRTVIVDRKAELIPSGLSPIFLVLVRNLVGLFPESGQDTGSNANDISCFEIDQSPLTPPRRFLVLFEHWRFVLTRETQDRGLTQDLLQANANRMDGNLTQDSAWWNPKTKRFDVPALIEETQDRDRERARTGEVLRATYDLKLRDGTHVSETVTIRILTSPIVFGTSVYLMSLVEGIIGVEDETPNVVLDRQDQRDVMQARLLPSGREMVRERAVESRQTGLREMRTERRLERVLGRGARRVLRRRMRELRPRRLVPRERPRLVVGNATRTIEYQNFRMRSETGPRVTTVPIPRRLRTIWLTREERRLHGISEEDRDDEDAERIRRRLEQEPPIREYAIPYHVGPGRERG